MGDQRRPVDSFGMRFFAVQDRLIREDQLQRVSHAIQARLRAERIPCDRVEVTPRDVLAVYLEVADVDRETSLGRQSRAQRTVQAMPGVASAQFGDGAAILYVTVTREPSPPAGSS